jgi:PAS domain S-box-containing protein
MLTQMKKEKSQTAELHYLERELEDLIQTSPSTWNFIREGSLDGVWYWDLEDTNSEWMSPEFWRLFGFNPNDMPHSPSAWQDLIFKEDLEVALENFNKHCADPSHPYDQIVRYKHADGSTVWVRCRGIAIRNEMGKPIRMLGAHNDITSIKKAEEVAKAEEEKAINASKELQSFAYALSHDLKAPANTVSAILSEINASYGESLNDDVKSLISMCEHTARRMQVLIEDVLSFTTVLGENFTFEKVDLNKIVREILSDLQKDIAEANAQIHVDDLPVIKANPMQMRLLMQNLMANAIKFKKADTAPKVKILSILENKKRLVGFKVSDNGIGIESKYRDRIFDLFTQLNLKSEFGGTGLGLAICKHIVVRHEGTIEVGDSSLGGASFTVLLPQHKSQ